MTGDARNGRYWPRSTTILRPTTIINPQGNVSVLTTGASHSAGVVNHEALVAVHVSGGVHEVTQVAHNLSTVVSTFLAGDTRASFGHTALVGSATFGASYNVLFLAPIDAHFVTVLTTSGSQINNTTLRASTPNVLVSAASSLVAVILARDIATSTSTTAGSSLAAAVSHTASIETLATFGAAISALTVGSTSLNVSTEVGVSVGSQILKASLLAVLNTVGVSPDILSEKYSPTGSQVSVAVIPLTFSGHNAPIAVAVVSTVGVSSSTEVGHDTSLATIVSLGADAPAITSRETFIEVLTAAGLNTSTALHLAINPILILRTSVGGTSMIQLGAEKMVEIQETQPGVTADV